MTKTNDVFPLPADCIAPSDTMKARQDGRSFPDSLSLFSLYPLAKVYCVLVTESYYVVMTGNKINRNNLCYFGVFPAQ